MFKLRNLLCLTVAGLLAPACIITTTSPDDDDDDDGAAETGGEESGDDDGRDSGDDAPADDGVDESGDETGRADPFIFDETPPDEMVQVDRMGMPAINTVVISEKDLYNGSLPPDDIAGTFVPEIVSNLEGLHGALDDDLTGAGLTPCGTDLCVEQAAPLVVPDVLALDADAPAGFPNGRMPADPVIDITLAVILLDLSAHGADTLAGLPLNPPANDLPFEADFPYLAPPHE